MIDFSVSIELAFAEAGRSFPDRVRAAATAGFPAVEIWDWRDKPLAELGRALRDSGTRLETLCVEDWRDKCQLVEPAEHAEFVRRVAETARVAVELQCPKLVVLAGDRRAGVALETQLGAAGEALLRASDAVADLPVELLVEVVNRQFEGPNALLATRKPRSPCCAASAAPTCGSSTTATTPSSTASRSAGLSKTIWVS